MPEKTIIGSGLRVMNWGVIELSGPDAGDFLNRLSTLDFRKPWSGVRLGGFLTGKSGIVTLGFFQWDGNVFRLLVRKALLATSLEHIEKFHFAENMKFEDVSASWRIVLQAGDQPRADGTHWTDPWVPEVTWTLMAAAAPVPPGADLDPVALEYAWARAGAPTIGRDIDSTVMLLEANLETAVDRNKGCYPGQEVVERIFTYGQVNRKLMPVAIEGDWRQASLPLKFTRDAKPAAVLTSAHPHPKNPSVAVGLAFIYRYFWDVSEPFEEAGVRIQILKNA